VRELLDIKEVASEIGLKFQKYLETETDLAGIGKFFVTDEE